MVVIWISITLAVQNSVVVSEKDVAIVDESQYSKEVWNETFESIGSRWLLGGGLSRVEVIDGNFITTEDGVLIIGDYDKESVEFVNRYGDIDMDECVYGDSVQIEGVITNNIYRIYTEVNSYDD